MLFYWIEQVYLIEGFTVGLKINLFEGWDELFSTRFFFFLLFKIFLMWNIFKIFIEFVAIFFLFWFFGLNGCRILDPWPRIEPASSALEGKALTTGPPGKTFSQTLDLQAHRHTGSSLYRSPKNLCTEIIAPQPNSNIWTWSLIDARVLSGMIK